MKAKYSDGQTVWTNEVIPGTYVPAGTRVAVIESYVDTKYGAETRYFVRTDRGDKYHAYESGLDATEPNGDRDLEVR